MDTSDLESKYQKLATEYSIVRSKATVLKKAVLDEQAKNVNLTEVIKKYEQTIRKHDQEMESLTFRNDQLAKRILVLQQELQDNCINKKSKNKTMDNMPQSDTTLLDQELQKKILENAQLVSNMADKDFELIECKQKIEWLEANLASLQKDLENGDVRHTKEVEALKSKFKELEHKLVDAADGTEVHNAVSNNKGSEQKVREEKHETDVGKHESFKANPESYEKLNEYYESYIKDILATKQLAVSEAKTLWAENTALKSRLENLLSEQKGIQSSLEKSHEEMLTTNENYRTQLDALTEHLAAQNEKITQQCDEIQVLKYKLSLKK